MAKMALQDRLMLLSESARTPHHVGMLATFTLPPDSGTDYLHDVVRRMRARTDVAAPFNYVLARPQLKAFNRRWSVLSDDRIDLDHHVRHFALPAPGGERELGVLVSRMHSRPLDLDRPLWEWTVIEGLAPDRWAVYFKVHHAVLDGVGAGIRISQILDPTAAYDSVRPVWTIGPKPRSERPAARPKPGPAAVVGRGARTASAIGSLALREFRDRRKPESPDLGVPFAAPRAVMNGRAGQQRRVATQTYDFDRLQRIARQQGGTLNDVFLTIIGGALRAYLCEYGELPDRSLTAGTPVSVRAEGDEAATNAFTMTVMQLRTDLADPVDRLHAVMRSSALAKQNLRRLPHEVVPVSAATFMVPFVLGQLVGTAGQAVPPYNVVVSNVPGPSGEGYFAGSRLGAVYPLSLVQHGVGLFIAGVSVAGSFNIGFTGDRDSVPHLQRLAVLTGDELAELEKRL